jgi:UDP-N-acetylmuramate dehydrogenase
MPLTLRTGVSLAPYTTFELGGPARFLVEVHDETELLEALNTARAEGLAVLAIGSGSNLVVADRGFDGMVVRLAMEGVETHSEDAHTLVTAAAGERWDALVARTVAEGWAGFECLSGIPGLVGATPIQNVGAYGQEVAETIASVRTVHVDTLVARDRPPEACGFRYRHSLFKEPEGRREIVTSVTFALRNDGKPTVRYPELERALGKDAPTLASVRDTVLGLRRAKSMVIDPKDENRRSAGSFFTNPVVTRAAADDVLRRAIELRVVNDPREMPRWDAGLGSVKLSAAWLIERAGFSKGKRIGAFGISSRHALALVHHGGGDSASLIAFARTIVASVQARFGVVLRPEPNLVGFEPGEGLG